jgi:hypothetical protein
MFARLQRHTNSMVVLRSAGAEKVLDPSVAEFLQHEFAKNIRATKSPEGGISSLSLPRATFRVALRDSHDLRELIRKGALVVQEVNSKGILFKRLETSDSVSGSVYVKDVKRVGVRKSGIGRGQALHDSIEVWGERLKDWAEIKIPAAILLTMLGGVLWGAYRLKQIAEDKFGEHAKDTARMIESDKGLEAVVQKRSGVRDRAAEIENKATGTERADTLSVPDSEGKER